MVIFHDPFRALFLPSCATDIKYLEIPISDRRMNLKGLEAISTKYLNEHPQDFHTFGNILTQADGALGKHELLTRGAVARRIFREVRKAGYNETMPVYKFLTTVYLEGWKGAYFTSVDQSDREYLYDLISAVMGGMHLCTTCSTSHVMEK